MKRFFETSATVALPFELPEAAVWSRLGRNRFLSRIGTADEVRLKLAMMRAAACCEPRGRWRLLEVTQTAADSVLLDNSWQISSRAFAEFVNGSDFLLLGGVTIGGKLAESVAQSDSLAEQAVYDAVGSECADQAIGTLFKMAGVFLQKSALQVGSRRFSPGYGGVELAVQRRIFDLLALEDLDMKLLENCIMQPEKSVTAFAGVMKLN